MNRIGILAMAVIGLPALVINTIPANAASGKCTSIQARCAVEIGGRCDPATGKWEYGKNGAGGK